MMNPMPDIPDEVLREMSRLALEQATESLARSADVFANDQRMKFVTGDVALRAFAAAIRSTNHKQFPSGEPQ